MKLKPEIKITALYIIIGILWITVSDYLLAKLFGEKILLFGAQMGKGIIYFLVTGIIIYFILKKYFYQLKQKNLTLNNLNQELIVKEKLYRILFESTGTATMMINEQDKVELVNDKLLEITGYSREELVGENYMKFIFSDDVELVSNYHQLRKKGKPAPEEYELRIKTKQGSTLNALVLVSLFQETEMLIVSLIDITERKQAEEKIKYVSNHDSLTDLYNRKYYEEQLQFLDREEHLPLSIIIGDVNGLKLTNDIFGHKKGDQLLEEVAQILQDSTRRGDIAARWGGDEFGILLPRTNKEEAKKVIERIRNNCRSSTFKPFSPQIAVGSATKESINQDTETIFKLAEDRMYRDKRAQKNSLNNPLISSLVEDLELSSYQIVGHTEKIFTLARQFGSQLDLSVPKLEKLILLAKFHDIGKIAIEDQIINKGSKLTAKEWARYQQHAKLGYDIAEVFPPLRGIAAAILAHEENWDGSGYPQGLAGTEIPFLARVIKIIDVFDALTNNLYYPLNQYQYYNQALSKEEALAVIEAEAEAIYDPDLAAAFVKMIREE